jgi:hypothetical protein
MNKSIALVVTAVLAAALSGCSIVGGGSTSEISKPGPEISQAPQAPRTDPPCDLPNRCIR